MAKYGYNKYGAGFKFGETTAISLYYNSQITAWAYDYGTTQINWANVVPNPTDAYPTHWKLVKSYVGTLDDPEDGITVIGGLFSEFVTSYTEISDTSQGREVNYSIWVFNGQRWIFCGSDYTIVVSSKDTLLTLTSWMPKAWVNQVDGIGEALGEVNSSDFVTTLGVFSFMYDKFRSEGSLLANVTNYNSTPVSIINTKITDFGFTYEPALGDSYHRSLFAAGNIINSYKGTSVGISAYATSLTHFSNDVEIGHNLMLDYNDSSFEESIGRWKVTTGTFTRLNYANISTASPAVFALIDSVNPPRTKGLGSLTIPTGATATLVLPDPELDILTNGIPVNPRTKYTFSGWAKCISGEIGLIDVYIKWYDRFGNYISTHTSDLSYFEGIVPTEWREFTSDGFDAYTGAESPKNAAFAGIELQTTVTGSSGTIYLDFFQFAETPKSFEYQDARKINVVVTGSKINKVPNNSFEDSVAFWDSLNGMLTRDTSNPSACVFGTSAAKLECTSAGTSAFVSDWFAVSASKVLTVSGYVTGPNPVTVSGFDPKTVKARVEFSNKQSIEAQISVLSDEDGEYFPVEVNYADSDPLVLSQYRQRVHVTALIPPNTGDSGPTYAKVSFYFEDSEVGDVYWLDGVMAENTLEPSDYFSGDGGLYPENPLENTFYLGSDCNWGTENIFNFVYNPEFQTWGNLFSTLDWEYSGSTLTVLEDDGAVTPLYGDRLAKLVGNSYHAATESNSTPVYSYIGPTSPYYYCPSGYFLDGNICRRETNPSQTTSVLVTQTCYSGIQMGGGCYNVSYPTTYTCPHSEDTLVDVGGVTQCFHDSTASATFKAYLTAPALGGEDFVGSVYVTGVAATYSIEGREYVVDSNHDDVWTRIHAVKKLTTGQTAVEFTVTVTDLPTEMSPVYLNAPQAEYGRIPSKYVGPTSGVKKLNYTAPQDAGHTRTYYALNDKNPNATLSNYSYNYELKSIRLINTLDLVVPTGSSYGIKVQGTIDNYEEIPSSLVPAASFETSIEGWTPNNSTIVRKVALGTLFEDTLTHGQAYASVASTGVGSSFGLSSGNAYVKPNGGYYASVAIRPTSVDAYGDYTLRVDFYDANDDIIQVYVDNITGNYTNSFVDASGVGNTLATDTVRSKTVSINNHNRWGYIAHTFPAGTVSGTAYAKVSITCEPTTPLAGQTFDVDRVIFRQ